MYAYTSGLTANDLYSNFGLPISSFIFSMNLQIFLISLCPSFIASNITSSGTSFAPASIIAIFSSVPATVNVKSDTFVGFITISPFTSPTFTAAVGPPNGMSDIDSAADAPIIAATLVSCLVLLKELLQQLLHHF